VCFEAHISFGFVIEKSMESDGILRIDPTGSMDSLKLKLLLFLHRLINSITFIIKVHSINTPLPHLDYVIVFIWRDLYWVE